MATFHSAWPTEDAQPEASRVMDGAADEVLGPVMAGAFARGVAETLELLGIPALFLDRSGEVLFASRAVEPLLQGPLRLHTRHLVAEHAGDNEVLSDFIAHAVGNGVNADEAQLPHAALNLRCLPRTPAWSIPSQLVRAVIIVADPADRRHEAMLRLL